MSETVKASSKGLEDLYELSAISQQNGASAEPSEPTSRVLSVQSSDAMLEPEGVTVQELHPVDRGVRAWTFCVSGCILEMMVWGFGFSYGIFQDYYTSHPPFEKSSGVAIAAIGTISLFIQYGEALVISLFLGRYPEYFNHLMWSGLAIYFASLFASSFATQVWQLILLQGIGVGVGGGMLYFPVIKLLPEWFSQRRGLAGGIIFSGTGVGGFVFPFIINALLDKVGLHWTLRIWAIGTTLCSGIALAVGMRRRLPVPKFTAGQRRPKFLSSQLNFFRSELFWSFSVANLLQGLSFFPVSLYIATFTSISSNQLTATIILALFNSSAVVGQVLLGHLSDRIPYPFIMAVSAAGSALSAFLLWGFASATVYLYFFVIIFGCLSGGFSSSWPLVSADIARNEPQYAGIVFAGISFSKGVSAVAGPIIAGLLLQAGKGMSMAHGFGRFGYGTVEIFVGSCAVACGLGSVVVALAKQRIAT